MCRGEGQPLFRACSGRTRESGLKLRQGRFTSDM
ncbi:hypothetical protein Nmel_006151 [Mimus melanotis]